MEGQCPKGEGRAGMGARSSCWFILYLSCCPLSSLLFRDTLTSIHQLLTRAPPLRTVTLHSGTVYTHILTNTQIHTVQLQHKTFSYTLLPHSNYTQCFHAHSLDNNLSFIPCSLQQTHTHTQSNTHQCTYTVQ